MHSKRRYKIRIRSVVLGELEHESFRNYKGFSIIFLKNFKPNLAHYEKYIYSSGHHIFASENLGLAFSYEK